MGTQILKGTKGLYTGQVISPDFGSKNFTVTQDTCLEAERLPIQFDDGIIETWIYMKDAKFTERKEASYG